MKPPIIPSDFVGDIRVTADQFAVTDFQDVIDGDYDNEIRCLLSDVALDYVDNNTLTQKWLDLFNGVTYVDPEEVTRISKGFVSYVKYFIFFDWTRSSFVLNSATGNVSNLNENAVSQVGNGGHLAVRAYNKGVRVLHNDVYRFISDTSTISEEITSSSHLTGTDYRAFIDVTTYLEAGDTVSINGTDYIVSAVNENVSFDFDSGQPVGLDFAGDTATWEPWKEYNFNLPIQDYTWF